MKFSKIFFILMYHTLVSSKLIQFFDNEIDLKKLQNYIFDIIKIYDKKVDSGYVGFISKDHNYFYDNLIKMATRFTTKFLVAKLNKGSTIYDINQIKSMKQGNLKLLLIYLQSTNDAEDFLRRLKNTPFYRPRSKILLILEGSASVNDLSKMFKSFWNDKFINVVSIFYQNGSVLMYTFNPFDDNKFLINITGMRLESIFYNRLTDINGYRLNILLVKYDDLTKVKRNINPDGTYQFSGQEIDLLRCLVGKMNGTAHFVPSAFALLPGVRNPWFNHNGNEQNYSGLPTKTRIFKQYSIDMINSEEMVLRDNLEGIAEDLYPHAVDDLKILIKRKGQMPYYTYLFLVFQSDLWQGLFVVFMIGSMIWNITSAKCEIDITSHSINMIRVFCGGSLPGISSKNSERTFLSFTFFFALIMITAFTSKLTTILMQDRFYPEYNTLEELQKDGVTMCGYRTQIVEVQKAFKGTFKESLFQYMEQVPAKYDHINNTLNNYTDFFINWVTKCPFVCNNQRLESYVMILKFGNTIGSLLFHVVKESVIPNYLAFRVKADSPFYDELNKNLRRIIETNLRKVMIQRHRHVELMTGNYVHPEAFKKDSSQTNPLSPRHLQAAFLILGSGLLFSLFIFMLELIYFKIRKKIRKDQTRIIVIKIGRD